MGDILTDMLTFPHSTGQSRELTWAGSREIISSTLNLRRPKGGRGNGGVIAEKCSNKRGCERSTAFTSTR
jgi:hypothetical protein